MAHIPIPQNSVVNLYSNIDITEGQEISFPSSTSQYEYFQKHLYKQLTNQSYTRHDGEVALDCSTSDAHKCNFLSFNNPSFEAKPFYCRIIDWEYVNPNTTKIYYEIDYYQTYMFDVTYSEAIIEREHMSEASYAAAQSDPWSSSDPYMLTEEPLATGLSVEAVYDGKRDWFTLPYQTSPGGSVSGGYSAVSGSGEVYARYVREGGHANNLYGNYDCALIILGGSYSYEKDTFLKELVDGMHSAISSLPDYSDYPVIASSRSFGNGFGGAVTGIILPLTNVSPFNEEVFTAAMNAMSDYLASKNATSSVIGIYMVPHWLARLSLPVNSVRSGGVEVITDYTPITTIEMPKPDILAGVHPKLNRMPFRYLRLTNPNGESKEFYVEYFKGGSVTFQVQSACWGIPVMALIPVDYKYTQSTGTVGSDRIYDERIEFSAFPQMGFASDQYLSYVGAQYQNLLASNTRSSQMEAKSGTNAIANVQNALGDIPRVIGDMLTTVEQGASSGKYYGEGGWNPSFSESLGSQKAKEQLGTLNAALSGDVEAYSDIYTTARDAFVVDDYHAGSTQNALMYEYSQNSIGFRATWVRLRDDVLSNYDAYLKMYGCSAKRRGVPYVCQWTQGGTQPHFEPLTHGLTTYVKTENMRVTGKNRNVCSYIENLFNGGCFFLKGDVL